MIENGTPGTRAQLERLPEVGDTLVVRGTECRVAHVADGRQVIFLRIEDVSAQERARGYNVRNVLGVTAHGTTFYVAGGKNAIAWNSEAGRWEPTKEPEQE
jgi:hypothetical protein